MRLPTGADTALGAAVLLMLTATAIAQTNGVSRSAAAGLSNSATLAQARQVRAKLFAAGFADIVNLQEGQDGTWSCRALRFGTTVRVEVDHLGKISIG